MRLPEYSNTAEKICSSMPFVWLEEFTEFIFVLPASWMTDIQWCGLLYNIRGQFWRFILTYLAVSADKEWLHFDGIIDHRHGAGVDWVCIAGRCGYNSIGHSSAAQRRGDNGFSWALRLAIGSLKMADSIIGSWESWAGVFDADHCGLLKSSGLLWRLISVWGDGETVRNQGLWPNLQTNKWHIQYKNKPNNYIKWSFF